MFRESRIASLSVAALVAGGCIVASGCMGGLTTDDGDECGPDRPCPAGYMCRAGSCYMEVGPGSDCVDGDGDGFRDGAGCPSGEQLDCNDSDSSINPGAAEICGDLIDQNCSAGEDEGCDCTDFGVGTTRRCSTGICAGVSTCNEDGWGPCTPSVNAQPEDCGPTGTGNGIDEDCDGDVDDGCITCGQRPDGTGTEDVCFEGGEPAYCSSNGTC